VRRSRPAITRLAARHGGAEDREVRSYDLVENLGRRSPRTLTPGADELAVGQRFVMIFRITSFEVGREITGVGGTRLLGPSSCTYRVVPAGPDGPG
jgi:hypothetical protein